jgi:hypothetical protein
VMFDFEVMFPTPSAVAGKCLILVMVTRGDSNYTLRYHLSLPLNSACGWCHQPEILAPFRRAIFPHFCLRGYS